MAKNKSSEGAQAQAKSAPIAKKETRKPARSKQPKPLEISPENRALTERVGKAAEQAQEKAGELLEQARGVDFSGALGFAKGNAVPLAILGLSAFWLYNQSQRPSTQEKLTRMKGKLTHSLSDIKEKASEMKDKASGSLEEYSGVAQEKLASASDNPLLIAAFAGGVGLALGLVLPLTSFENETFRSARQSIKETVQEKVEQVTETVSALKEKASDVVSKVEETVSAS